MPDLAAWTTGTTKHLSTRLPWLFITVAFKGGQSAKTGTGGHLPGAKVWGKIAAVRGLPEGQPGISPTAFSDPV